MKNSDKPKIGELIFTTAKRDAIHIAVAPVRAAIDLYPGQHIGLNPDDDAGVVETPIGIVDPFLKNKVMRGDCFYIFMYPDSTTNLRHEWDHPAFKLQPSGGVEENDECYGC